MSGSHYNAKQDTGDDERETTPGVIPWPRAISDVGMYGIAGDFVRLSEPHTEADPNIILLTFLVYAGNIIGRNFYVAAGADKHCGNIFLCKVGHTGYGRKGSADSVVESFFRAGNAPGLPHMLYGISSGEGVINEIRDPTYKTELNKKTRKSETRLTDAGISDKRLIINLSEMHQCLAMIRRSDSILSSVIRQAWDKDMLSSPSKNSGVRASGAHVSITGGISQEEFLRQVTAADAENGTLNRFLIACSHRSKKLPEGGKFFNLIESSDWSDLQTRFNQNIANLNNETIQLKRDANASDNWGIDATPDRGLYDALTHVQAGLWGDITARAAQQVMRLSLTTAVINGYREIRDEHQEAAAEQWRYCDESARHTFGGQIDNPVATRIIEALQRAQLGGLTRTELRDLFQRHRSANEIDQALRWLANIGLVRCEVVSANGRGRPTERWFTM
jgi:hypothetical protein